MTTKFEKKENFEYWLFNMDNFWDEFFSLIPRELASQLDYSPKSLDHLEAYVLEHYESIDEIRQDSEAKALNALSIYVGETFRKNLGGTWQILLEDETQANFGVPSLKDIGPKKRTDAPIYLVTASISRRRGDYISGIFEYYTK